MNEYRRRYLEFVKKQDEKIHAFLDKHAIFALSEEEFQEELRITGWPEYCVTRIANFLWMPDVYLPDMERCTDEIEAEKKEFLEIEDNFIAMTLYAFDEYEMLYSGYKKAIELETGWKLSDFSEKQMVLLEECVEMYIDSKNREFKKKRAM